MSFMIHPYLCFLSYCASNGLTLLRGQDACDEIKEGKEEKREIAAKHQKISKRNESAITIDNSNSGSLKAGYFSATQLFPFSSGY
jgi:hypothetical protein